MKLSMRANRAAAVEYAVVSVIFVALTLGLFEFGRALYLKNQLSYLADQAAQRVLQDPEISNSALESEVSRKFSAGNTDALAVIVTGPTEGPSGYRMLTIGYPMTRIASGWQNHRPKLSVTRRIPGREIQTALTH